MKVSVAVNRSIVYFTFLVTLAVAGTIPTAIQAKPVRSTSAPVYHLDECDSVFQLSIKPEGQTIRLSWFDLPGVSEWIVFRASDAQMSDIQIAATVADTNTWLEATSFVTNHDRAFYRVAARWFAGSPDSFRVIENFDYVMPLESYSVGEDRDPTGWQLVQDGVYSPLGNSLELTGNTWKREWINPVPIVDGTRWRITAKMYRMGDTQAFGVADSVNEMWYSLWGRHMMISQAWNLMYQGWSPDSVWSMTDLPIADDWFGRFGYYPRINQLLFANDSDTDTLPHGIVRFDEIRDVTGTINLPPAARFRWWIQNRPSADSMDVAFCSMGCDPDGPLFKQFWSFGDGTTGSGANPVHRYRSHGMYKVALTVTDSSNQVDWVIVQVNDTTFTATQQISTIFTGDAMMGRRYEEDGGPGIIPTLGVNAIFARMQPLISSFELAMTNLECPLTNSTTHHPTKLYYFKGRPEYVSGLAYAGFDFASLANNHTFDYLEAGMHETMHVLDSVAILNNGSGDDDVLARVPVFYSKNGLSVAILSFCNRIGTDDNAQPFLQAGPSRPGFAMWDRANIERMIPAARQIADVVVVQVHSGIEYATTPPGMSLYPGGGNWAADDDEYVGTFSLLPDTSDVELRHYAIDLGADLIINHHPHVIQGCELYNGKLIAHSMGNFAFEQQLPETFISMVIQTVLRPGSADDFIVHPVYIDRYIPGEPTGALAKAILDYISDLSRPMHTWIVRDPAATTAYLATDTLVARVGQDFRDTLALANSGSYAVSAPFRLDEGGYPVSLSMITPAGAQYRLGRDVLYWGNIEDEGATPWDLNSAYEAYDNTVFHSGARSIGLTRSGGGTNSVSTSLKYRPPFDLSKSYSFIGWIKGQTSREAQIEFEWFAPRSGGAQSDSILVGGSRSGTFNWTRVYADLDPPDNGYTFNIKVNLRSPTSGEGKAWFDDMALVKWESWRTGTVSIPFPSDINYVQVRTSTGTTSAIISYRREWLSPSADRPLGYNEAGQQR
jgi:poly-gamma-glutamate capsule biosynthesis protein CapA/YwtB (metallophosphatase superfamily)